MDLKPADYNLQGFTSIVALSPNKGGVRLGWSANGDLRNVIKYHKRPEPLEIMERAIAVCNKSAAKRFVYNKTTIPIVPLCKALGAEVFVE